MARRVTGKLTARFVSSATEGTHGDGGGLWLQVRTSGRSWLFRFISPVTRKARLMGLGSAAVVSLAEARQAAASARALLQGGTDPLDAKRGPCPAFETPRTFRQAAEAYISTKRDGWRSTKHAKQWAATLEKYAYPAIGNKPVATITVDDILVVLRPIWIKGDAGRIETASRLRGRLQMILGSAKAQHWFHGENPATWTGHLSHVLPARSAVKPVKHHRAIPWADTGSVMKALAESKGTGALAVRFTCLTAARSSEVRGATWAEIDLVAAVWTVPGDRMKAGREHRVPLSAAALAVLAAAKRLAGGGAYLFPGGRTGRPLSDVALSKALHGAAGSDDVTVHGLRSTFRDWAAEDTAFPRDVAEMALAHTVRDKTEAAYRRGDLFEKRRTMMDEWATYCTS